MSSAPGNESNRADPDVERLRIEEDYDMMFGPGAFRWAEERASRRLRQSQAEAVAEAERVLRSGERN
jgi:hypothetical protein